jgi:predicted O-methyltransferase YrrM
MSINHIIPELKKHFRDRPIKIAELGVLRGQSIPIFLNNFNIEEYVGVDLFDCYEENKDGSYELMKTQGSMIYNSLELMYQNNSNIKFKIGLTNKVVQEFENKYFDLIFIDAGHEYPQVSQDIELWYPKMKKNGVFSGDDYFYPPVKKSVHEFINKHDIKLHNSIQKNPDANVNDYWSWYIFT